MNCCSKFASKQTEKSIIASETAKSKVKQCREKGTQTNMLKLIDVDFFLNFFGNESV